MANLESTMRRVNAITSEGGVIVPEWVLVELRRQRDERRRRIAATILGQAELEG